jgi:hypothetical protein
LNHQAFAFPFISACQQDNCGNKIGAEWKARDKYANPYLDLSDKVVSERPRDGLGTVCGVELGAKFARDLVDEMF